MFIAISIFLGVLSYGILQILNYITSYFRHENYELIDTFKALTSNGQIPFEDVFYSSLLGIILAFLLGLLDHKNIINRIGRFLNLTSKASDESLFMQYLSQKDLDVIYVRDIKNNLTYFGRIFSFAEKENVKELVLEDVTVYLYDQNIILYTLPSVYLVLNDGITIDQAVFIGENIQQQNLL